MQHPQGEDRVIAGEAEGRAVGQVLQCEPEERSIRHGRRVLEHPPRRILPEPETHPGIEGQFSGMQGGKIAGVAPGQAVNPSKNQLSDREMQPSAPARGADRGQLLLDDQASRGLPCPPGRP